jgi:hypothetical protein
MKNAILISVVFLFCFSCIKKEVSISKEKKVEKEFDMYELSEMAALMEQMYVDNEHLRERIILGDSIGEFPIHFLKIHAAVMTDEQENDAFFKAHAADFVKSQKLIYEDPKKAKIHFNKSVDACIQCHEVKCGGPIPRIRKLYIK